MQNQIAFICFFLIIAPIASVLAAEDICYEEIFSPLRAWAEAKELRMLSYLLSCAPCMTHWTMAFLTIIFWHDWNRIAFCNGFLCAFLCWAAGTWIAIKAWL